MCGIAGIARAGGPVDARAVKSMTELVRYRGPDDEGYCCWGAVSDVGALPTDKTLVTPGGAALGPGGLVLGHRRLAILDLSTAGRQPMRSGDGRYWIVFNGEIYNYRELQAELRLRGEAFASDTDTEVILAAFAAWGPGCLARFNGMWSFVLYDAVEGVLFASRDRFGVKPFYYAIAGDQFAFASETKQLHHVGLSGGGANREQVARFLLFGEVNFSEQTCFEGVQQLQPGNAIRWKIAEGVGAIRPSPWYQLPASVLMRPDGKVAEYREEFAWVLEDAVKLRLRSDVPVGSCLSGGLDSSAIVLLANELLRARSFDGRQHTFTACAEDQRFDEWRYADQIIRAAGVRPHRVVPDLRCLWEEMPSLAWHQDEPFRTTSIYAQWNVMRLAREHVTVLLDGQGADEILLGYHYLIPFCLAALARGGQPGRAWSELRAFARTGLLSATESRGRTLAKIAYHALGLRGFRPGRLNDTLRSEYRVNRERPVPVTFPEMAGNLLAYLQSLLRYEDRNSMAFSIEARTPFLDYRLVELCARIPLAYRMREGWTKPFLREVMSGRMPDPVRLRVDKMGYVTPEAAWIRADRHRIRTTLLNPASPVSEWVDLGRLRQWLDREERSCSDGTVWRLLSVHFWSTRFGLS